MSFKTLVLALEQETGVTDIAWLRFALGRSARLGHLTFRLDMTSFKEPEELFHGIKRGTAAKWRGATIETSRVNSFTQRIEVAFQVLDMVEAKKFGSTWIFAVGMRKLNQSGLAGLTASVEPEATTELESNKLVTISSPYIPGFFSLDWEL